MAVNIPLNGATEDIVNEIISNFNEEDPVFNNWKFKPNIEIGTLAVSTNSSPNIAIGANSKAQATVSDGNRGQIAIGVGAEATGGEYLSADDSLTLSIAIGAGAKATEDETIQLGAGTNSTPYSFQVDDFTMLNTLTGKIPVERLPNGVKVVADGISITGDGTTENPLIAHSSSNSQYPTLVQKLFSGVSVIYAWKGDTTSTIIAKSSSIGTVSGRYIDSSDSTMYVFSIPAGISFYLGDDSSENLFYTDSVLSTPATTEDLESKQDKLVPGENITIDGNTISASGNGNNDYMPQLVLETFVPLPPLNSVSIIFGFSGDTTSIITPSCNEDITFNAGIYNSGSNITTYTANFSLDILNDGISVTPIFTIQENGVEMPIWSKSYGPIDFGIVSSTSTTDVVPIENSTNLVTSGGVYQAIQDVIEPQPESLADVKPGEDISGLPIDFTDYQFSSPSSDYKAIVFDDGSWLGYKSNGMQWAFFNADGSVQLDIVDGGNVWGDGPWVVPDNKVVSSVGENISDWDLLTGAIIKDADKWATESYVSENYISKTDLDVDGAPTKGSTNLVASGGIYSFTTAKTIGADFSGTLADVTVGMNLDGVTLHLPYNVATGNDENETHLIDFADGSWIGWSSIPYGYGQIDSAGNPIMGVGNASLPEWNTDSTTWWHETHTIPPGTGDIVAVAPNINDFNIATLTTFDIPGKEITLTVQDVSDNVNEKVDKYYDLIPGTKTFEELVVGDDLSGVTVTFPDPIDMVNLTGASTNSHLVDFTNGYYINLSINTVQTPAYFRLIDTNGQTAQYFYENSKIPTVPAYTFPDGFVISNIDISDINQFYGGSWQKQLSFEMPVESEITIKWLYDQIMQETANLQSHVLHDADLYQSILSAARQEAQDIYDGTEVPLSSTGTTIIGTGGLLDLGGTGQYVIPANGGITITFSAVLALGNVQVYVNGASVFDSSAISLLSVPPPTTIRVNGGDMITSTGSLGLLSSLNVTFYPNL